MSQKTEEDKIKDRLDQLRCHFTWEMVIEDTDLADLENRIFDEIEFLDTKYNVGIHNLLAYVKHLKGQNKEALESLKTAEGLIQQEHAYQSDPRSLITWGNYAWLYYHMDQLAEAKVYLDKVENICKKFASPSRYRMECPKLDCEEGWALVKCGRKNYKRAKDCFEKALEVDPQNPEFNTGYAITWYRLDSFNKATQIDNAICVQSLKQAVKLNPEDAYIKTLLGLKLQDLRKGNEGEKYIEEALTNMSSQPYVFRYAAKFYRRKGSVDKAIQLLKMALRATPSSAALHHQIGLAYKAQLFQIKKATNWHPRGRDRENVNRIMKLAISHFEFAVELKPKLEIAYIHLAEMYSEAGNYSEAEGIYQKLLCMTSLEEEVQRELHFQYGRFQEFQRKSEIDAIAHYLKVITVEKPTYTMNKSIYALEKLALKRFQRNAFNIENLSILGFVYKLKGEMDKALEYYERALKLAADFENSVGHTP